MKVLKSKSGYSMPELLAAIVIVAISMLGMTTVTYVASSYSISLQEEFNALTNAYRMEFTLRKILSLAVHVVPEAEKRGPDGTAYQGYFANDFSCNSVQVTANCPKWKEVAVFFREDATGVPSTVAGVNGWGVRPTGIWYRSPDHSPDPRSSTSGALIIDLGGLDVQGNPVQNSANLLPDGGSDNLFFDHMTSFSMSSEVARDGISSVVFNYTLRSHGASPVRSWCPRDELGVQCVFNGGFPNFQDRDYSFRVALVNNRLADDENRGGDVELRALGPIHFFKAIRPVGQ